MRRYEWIFSATAVIIALIIFLFTWVGTQTGRPHDLIRLHVIANSDSPEDQELKLHVRDRLLTTFGKKFRQVQSMNEARETIKESLPELEKTAMAEIRERGYSYDVKAQLGIFPFPTRVYGDMVFPAGSCEALRVIIGDGKGANWWCVMFPPLCFVDVSSGIVEQDLNGSCFEPEQKIEYKFKVVELWNDLMNWVNNLIS